MSEEVFGDTTQQPEEEKKKSNAGRPTKYKPEYAKMAYKLCLLKKATDKELAEIFDTTEQTVNSWKQNYPEFLESIKKGKELADAQVAASLYERATGYSHPEDKIFQYEGVPVVVPTIKHYAPETAAGIFWLKNRQRLHWRDKIEHDVSNAGKPVKVMFVSPELQDDDVK